MSGESGLDPHRHALAPSEHEAIFQADIVPRVLDLTPPVEDPWALVLAGRARFGQDVPDGGAHGQPEY